ncbi:MULTISPECIES: hypothetical protein [unclassified Streptomyces]|uniref:hypothetical protein n=1 Tax=unclassified Streptomyces TaxID=2593676 RepID=UPI00226F352A|nr:MULTISPECIES: hypothetical protein [unclassified Streptomyces]MCY0922959.1 hypothetical protein [Streptomyces sp. H27-G5]MCY0960752.1 hypothetical protein [Streptomyces sp. H27-H5]
MSEYAEAKRMETAALLSSGWYARYLWVFAVGQLVLVPVSLLWHGAGQAVVFTLANTLLVGGLSVYAARQRVVRRGFGLKHGLVIGTWGAVFGAAVVLGTGVFRDDPAFTVVAAVACALPAAVGAMTERRAA